MENLWEEHQQAICYEGDAEGQDYLEKISLFCDELEKTALKIESSFFS